MKGVMSLRGLSISDSNNCSIKKIVIQNREGVHGKINDLMKRQKKLIKINNKINSREYFKLKLETTINSTVG